VRSEVPLGGMPSGFLCADLRLISPHDAPQCYRRAIDGRENL